MTNVPDFSDLINNSHPLLRMQVFECPGKTVSYYWWTTKLD